MSTKFSLCLEDDGTITVETEEVEAAEPIEEEQAEGGQKTPVKSVDEGLAMIKQLAEAASMSPPEGEGMGMEEEKPTEDPALAAGQEDEAMMGGFRKGVVQ